MNKLQCTFTLAMRKSGTNMYTVAKQLGREQSRSNDVRRFKDETIKMQTAMIYFDYLGLELWCVIGSDRHQVTNTPNVSFKDYQKIVSLFGHLELTNNNFTFGL